MLIGQIEQCVNPVLHNFIFIEPKLIFKQFQKKYTYNIESRSNNLAFITKKCLTNFSKNEKTHVEKYFFGVFKTFYIINYNNIIIIIIKNPKRQ